MESESRIAASKLKFPKLEFPGEVGDDAKRTPTQALYLGCLLHTASTLLAGESSSKAFIFCYSSTEDFPPIYFLESVKEGKEKHPCV